MNQSSTHSKQYDAKYDLIKFFLSLAVLAIHSALYPMVLYPWLRIAVPLFFMMSSYFFFSKLRGAPTAKQKTMLQGFVLRNLQLYLCWFVILLPITLYGKKDEYFSNGVFENIGNFLKNFLFDGTFVASWFILATIWGVLIIYALSKWLKNDFVVLLICCFSFCVVTLASSYESVIADTFAATAIYMYNSLFGNLVFSFPAALFWIYMGKLIAEEKLKLKSLWLILCFIIVSAIGLFLEWKFVMGLDGSYNNDSYFMLAPLCVLLFLGLQKLKPIHWKHSIHFKRASTIIYVAHGTILFITSKVTSVLFNLRVPLLSFILTFLCCVVLYVLIEIAIGIFRRKKVQKVLKMLY